MSATTAGQESVKGWVWACDSPHKMPKTVSVGAEVSAERMRGGEGGGVAVPRTARTREKRERRERGLGVWDALVGERSALVGRRAKV